MQIHNHGTEEGPGLSCPEYRTSAGTLRGRCMPEVAYVTAPDSSVTITDDEAMYAIHLLHKTDWDQLEAGIAPGALDTEGTPINRHNRHVRLAVLAEAVALACGASGKGMERMDNPHYETYINALLDSFDKTKAAAPYCDHGPFDACRCMLMQ